MVLVARLLLIIILLGLYRGTSLQYVFLFLFYLLAFRSIVFLFAKPFFLAIFTYFVSVQFLNASNNFDALFSLSLPLSIPVAINLTRRLSYDLFESLLIKLCAGYTFVYIILWMIAGNFNFQIFNFITGTYAPSKFGALDVIPIVAYLIYLSSKKSAFIVIILVYFIFYVKPERGMLISLPIFVLLERNFLFNKYRNLVKAIVALSLVIGFPIVYKYGVYAYENIRLFVMGNKSFDSSINSRIDQLTYVFSDYSLLPMLIGHGIPRESAKNDQIYIDYFYWQDLGILGIYWTFGLLGILLIFYIARIVIMKRDRLKPMSRYILVLLIINSVFTAKILFSFGLLISAYIYLENDNNNRSLRQGQGT